MTVDWRSFVLGIEPKARVTAPATAEQILAVERAVGATFPADLRALYLQTDGIQDDGFGPILPLSGKPGPFVDGRGQVRAAGTFPAHDYSVIQYTPMQRSLWQDDAGVDHDTFVVIGLDIGGNPFGFFAGTDNAVRIRSIAHDDGSVEPNTFSLAQYLRHYFAKCPWFNNKP
jgi:SMI1 / KNR4 family (SUKH-1)